MELHSVLAKRMAQQQRNCSLPLVDFRYRNMYGLGSDLHVWTQAMCKAIQEGVRIRTEPPWIYLDTAACHKISSNSAVLKSNPNQPKQVYFPSAMTCYFPQSELLCQDDAAIAMTHDDNSTNRKPPPKIYVGSGNLAWVAPNTCPQVRSLYNNLSISDVRAAGIEFLFSHVSPIIVAEAKRQAAHVFRRAPVPGQSPSNLITVQVRWGDKKDEMKLVPAEKYVQAIETILLQRRQPKIKGQQQPGQQQSLANNGAHIFLSTEDPDAVRQFSEICRDRNWTLYVDEYFSDFLNDRSAEYNGNPKMAQNLQGQPGLVALGSLLVAMQANDFVLTTGSNWSRLINELRKNILDPRCGNCTTMVDLSFGEW